jgi:hypothetical protein
MSLRVTRRAWFGPKKVLGWGFSPISWEGGLVSAGFIVLTLVSVIIWQGTGAMIAVPVLIGLLLVIALLTGDPPGGPGS